jgi:hypothetical protein
LSGSFFVSLVIRGRDRLSLASCRLRTNHPSFSAHQKKSLAAGGRVHKTYHFPSNTFFLLSITSCRCTSYTALSTTPHHTPSVRCAPPNYTYSPEPVAFSGHLPAWQTQTEIHPVPLHQRLGACCGNTQPCAWSTHSMDCRQTWNTVSPRGHRGLIKESTSQVV